MADAQYGRSQIAAPFHIVSFVSSDSNIVKQYVTKAASEVT